VTLSKPTGGATLGSNSTETVTIINNLPPSVGFSSSQYSAYAGSGQALITVVRSGPAGSPVSVKYSASGGTGIPGRDYRPVSGTLSFSASQTSLSFAVPLLIDASAAFSPSVILSLAQPSGGASLGTISRATLMISETPPASTTSPSVISKMVATNGRAITAITFGFDKQLDPGRATQLGNYGYFVVSAGAGGAAASRNQTLIALRSAVYDSSSRTVTLTPSTPLRLGTFYQVTIDGHTSPLLNNGLTDTYGNLLAGSTGSAGSPYVATFAVGTSFVYADGGGNTVSLNLRRGGLMELFRSPSGTVERLEFTGVVPRQTTLTGSLKRAPGGSGRTYLPLARSAAGVRINLKTPPFFFNRPKNG
jgi:hypothetical protein